MLSVLRPAGGVASPSSLIMIALISAAWVSTDAKAQTLHAFLSDSATHKHTTAQPFAGRSIEEDSEQQLGVGPPAAAAAAAAVAATASVPRRRAGTAAGAGTFNFVPMPLEMIGGIGGNRRRRLMQQQSRFVASMRQQCNVGTNSELTSVQALLAETEARPHAGELTYGWFDLAACHLAKHPCSLGTQQGDHVYPPDPPPY